MMNCRSLQRFLLARCLPRVLALACATVLIVGVPASANAGNLTILQYAQVSASDIVTAAESGGVTTLSTAGNGDGGNTSIPVTVTNFLGAPFPPIPVFETFVDVHSVGAATVSGTTITQQFTGTIEFTGAPNGAGTNYLTATFSSATFSGSVNGGSATMSASQPTTSVVFTSDFAPPPPFLFNAMALSFSGIGPPLTTTDGSLGGFTAQNAGTFSSAVPEPGTITLSSMAIVIGVLAGWRKRRGRSQV